MTPDQLHEAYQKGFVAGKSHKKPSGKTVEMLNEQKIEVSMLTQKIGDYMENHQLVHDDIAKDISEIKNNHLAHVEKDLSSLKTDFVTVKTDVSWLKRFFWVVATASIGALITGILNLVLK